MAKIANVFKDLFFKVVRFRFLNVLVSKEIKWSSHEIKTSYHEKRLHDFYSRVVMHQKTQSFSALTRSFFYASLLVNKNRSCAPSMK